MYKYQVYRYEMRTNYTNFEWESEKKLFKVLTIAFYTF